ncbi:MAG: M12 family metallo-peptidase [Verrucomicrobiota bacterium]|nr:M12 family metallo-peptidase [Limisphaera sp.]MDW8383101.1 M12 family metallo-peptidase [Verrucomicrobiota bacterium]
MGGANRIETMNSIRQMLPLLLEALMCAWAAHGIVPGQSVCERRSELWTYLPGWDASAGTDGFQMDPGSAHVWELNLPALLHRLSAVPREDAPKIGTGFVLLELPQPGGMCIQVRCVESPVMEDELAFRYPDLRTFRIIGVDVSGLVGRVSLTPAGLHGRWCDRGRWWILEPHPAHLGTIYRVYAHDSVLTVAERWICETVAPPLRTAGTRYEPVTAGEALRMYRLAIAATGEWTASHGGTVKSAMAALVILVNQLNAIYESEVAIRFVLVGQNDRLIFTNAATDPFSGSDAVALLDQNQATIDRLIGETNYDLGHILSRVNGGLASLGVVCRNGLKARGQTGVGNSNDPLFVDYVAHEIGHQFGATHTFNGIRGACGANRDASTGYEPGSGSTLMAYAGNCQGDNVQFRADLYFHAASLDQILQGAVGWPGSTCARVIASGNRPPVVTTAPTCAIPRGTPFVLTAFATDADGHPVTYCWEQMDLGPAATLDAVDTSQGPLFRSVRPNTNAARVFPSLDTLLHGQGSPTEKLPTTGRTIRFRVTARDGRGGIAGAETVVTVAEAAGPFRIVAPNGGETWSNVATIRWEVAGTTQSPVNVTHVNLWLSTNNGATFPHLLAGHTPNDGAETVTLPPVHTTLARVKVEAVGQPFFDFSDASFTLLPLRPVPSLTIWGATVTGESCQPGNGSLDPGEIVTISIGLQNQVPVPTTNLVAKLLAGGGVVTPGPAQVYGVLNGGQTVWRPFTFTASGRCGDPLWATLELEDAGRPLGTVTRSFTLGEIRTQTVSRANAATIRIPGSGTEGSASVFPSTVSLSGLTGRIARARVILVGLSHAFAGDLDILLVPPQGRPVLLMSDVGNGTNVNGTLTFDDAALHLLPLEGPIRTSTNRPTPYDPDSDTGLTSVIPGPYATELAALHGSDPNGLWSLYIWDDTVADIGELSFGWRLELTLTSRSCCGWTENAPPVLGTIVDQVTDEDAPLLGLRFELSDPDTPLDQVRVTALSMDPGLVAPTGLVVRGSSSVRSLDIYPEPNAYGSTFILVLADDGMSAATNTFSLVVRPVNDPPEIPAERQMVIHAGTFLTLTNTARDVETPTERLRYNLASPVPPGVTLDQASGLLQWQTTDAQAGETFDLRIIVADDHIPPGTATSTVRVVVVPRPKLRVAAVQAGQVILEWNTLVGATYLLESTDQLENPVWTAVGPLRTAQTGSLSVVEPTRPVRSRFYRVRLWP